MQSILFSDHFVSPAEEQDAEMARAIESLQKMSRSAKASVPAQSHVSSEPDMSDAPASVPYISPATAPAGVRYLPPVQTPDTAPAQPVQTPARQRAELLSRQRAQQKTRSKAQVYPASNVNSLQTATETAGITLHY